MIPQEDKLDIRKFIFGSINKKLLFWFLIISIIPLAIVSIIAINSLTNNTYSDTIYEVNVELTIQNRTINSFLKDVEGDVLFLSQIHEIEELVNTNDSNIYQKTLHELESEFLAFSKNKKIYYQLRYINETGQEVLRIEYDKKKSRVIPEEELQNKRTSYYFNDAMNATKETVFISPMDPNFEDGKIENRGTDLEPIYVPVVRYATPIYDYNGNPKGIIIANVYADHLLDSIKTPYEPGQKTMLVNSDGFYLLHPNKSKEWGFIFGNNENIKEDYSFVSEDILENSNIQSISENQESFFMFQRIYPSGEEEKSIESGHYTDVISNPQGKEYYWILVKEVNKDSITVAIYETIQETYFVVFLVLTGIVIISFFVALRISNPIKKLEKIANEMEKGNFNSRVKINTRDELESLGHTLNQTASTLQKTDELRRQLDNAKTEFLSITSHELRSPMTPMKAQLQMILKEYMGHLNSKQRNSLNIVLRNTERLDEIIKDFLEISRIEAARLKFTFVKSDLSKYVRHIAKEMDNYLPEKKIKIGVNVSNLPIVEVDPNRVMQVFRNLLTNAKKFSPPNSKIVIGGKKEEEYIKFWVKDHGIGVRPQDKLRIFEPFFQAEQTIYRKYSGTGLGLTICKGIIEAQKGSMWIESKKGKGTTFFFTVPMKPEKAPQSIKLLFSEKESINKKLETLFTLILGPLGKEEFEKLNERQSISKEKVIKYVNSLIKKGIINKTKGNYFKNKTTRIFRQKITKGGKK